MPTIASETSAIQNHSGDRNESSQNNGKPSNVPTVPGALGLKPVPKPKASRCAGWDNKKRRVGLLEVVKAGNGYGNGLTILIEHVEPGAFVNLSDPC